MIRKFRFGEVKTLPESHESDNITISRYLINVPIMNEQTPTQPIVELEFKLNQR